MFEKLTPELVIAGYCGGIFPMADPDSGDTVFWYRPDPRAILPLDSFHVPRNLAKVVRRGVFDLSHDSAFADVVRACANRPSTWISDEIARVFTQLHHLGVAHSVECRHDGQLVGGLYGVALGGVFFGESMFHHMADASKVALVHLVDHLRARGYSLLDVQYATPHLSQFGVKEISACDYEQLLQLALDRDVHW